MAKHENLPFPIGSTYFDGQTIASADVTASAHLEGRVYEIEDLDYSDTDRVKPARTNILRKVMVVRNTSAGALLPKRLVTFEADGVEYLGRVDGYARTTAVGPCFPVDEFLPSAGVPVNDLFYICIDGPAMCLMPLSNLSADTAVGDWLVAITAASSGATTAGRIAAQDLTGATALLGAQIQHRLGRALSVKLTSATNADILVNITKY